MKKLLTGTFIILLSTSVSLAGEFDYSAYEPSSVPEIIEEHRDIFFKEGEMVDFHFSAILFKYRITVEFTKKLREIKPEKKLFVEKWVKSFKYDPAFIDVYKHELLIQVDGTDYWIPIQEQLLPYMGNELVVGSKFDLYIIFVGTVKDKWMFLATEFNSPAQRGISE